MAEEVAGVQRQIERHQLVTSTPSRDRQLVERVRRLQPSAMLRSIGYEHAVSESLERL